MGWCGNRNQAADREQVLLIDRPYRAGHFLGDAGAGFRGARTTNTFMRSRSTVLLSLAVSPAITFPAEGRWMSGLSGSFVFNWDESSNEYAPVTEFTLLSGRSGIHSG